MTANLRLTPLWGNFCPTTGYLKDKRPLTLAQLLAHRAGLPAWEPFYEKILPAPPESRRGLLPRLAAAAPLIYPPGTVTLYSDLGFMLLQAVVETVSGLPLDHFCAGKSLPSPGAESLGFQPLAHFTPCGSLYRKPKTENRKPSL